MDGWREWIRSLFAEAMRRLRKIRIHAPSGFPSPLGAAGHHKHVDHSPRQLGAIEKARQELIAARNHFDAVSDPELVDIAIYDLHAAQLKYSYLIRQAKRENVQVPGLGRTVSGSH